MPGRRSLSILPYRTTFESVHFITETDNSFHRKHRFGTFFSFLERGRKVAFEYSRRREDSSDQMIKLAGRGQKFVDDLLPNVRCFDRSRSSSFLYEAGLTYFHSTSAGCHFTSLTNI